MGFYVLYMYVCVYIYIVNSVIIYSDIINHWYWICFHMYIYIYKLCPLHYQLKYIIGLQLPGSRGNSCQNNQQKWVNCLVKICQYVCQNMSEYIGNCTKEVFRTLGPAARSVPGFICDPPERRSVVETHEMGCSWGGYNSV